MGRFGTRGNNHRGRRGHNDFTKRRQPQLNPSVLVDRRFALQPIALGATPQGSSTTTLFPPTRLKRYQAADFPQDRRYFCDRCFRGYHTNYYFEMHLKNHVQCIADGCKFSALPRVVARHLLTFHSCNTSTANGLPSSLASKWLQDRKRNFPSKEQVERKRQRAEDKVERGEVLETTNKFGRFKLALMKEFVDKPLRNGSACPKSGNPNADLEQNEKDQVTEERAVGSTELITMLLTKEIQHERNVLLQCIRHIVTNGPTFGINDWSNAESK